MYVLSTSGPQWISEPYGYHAPGALICKTCSDRHNTGGSFHFRALDDLKKKAKTNRPKTSEERLARRQETFGYPLKVFEPDDLDPLAARDDVRIGSLAGYAVLFELADHALKRHDTDKWPRNAKPFALLAVYLADDCVEFETTILTLLQHDQTDWSVLDGLLEEVIIEKTSLDEVPPPKAGAIVVRPRLPGERPMSLHEQMQ